MLRVDEGSDATQLLCIRDDVATQRRLAARFGSVDLSHATARNSTDADRGIQVDRAGRYGLDADLLLLVHPHDRALATALLDLRDREVQRLLLVVCNRGHSHSSTSSRLSWIPLATRA